MKFITALLIILLTGNGLMSQNRLTELEWLLDTWISIDGKTNTYETWSRTNDSTFTGSGRTTDAEGNLLSEEKLMIISKDNEIYYIADVAHNISPVNFKLTSRCNNKLVFENRDHDFPHMITYELESPDKLHAWVEGPGKDGSWKKFDFIFTRTR